MMVADGKMKENVFTVSLSRSGAKVSEPIAQRSLCLSTNDSFYPCKTLYVVFSNLLSKRHYFTSKPVWLSSELTAVYSIPWRLHPAWSLGLTLNPSGVCLQAAKSSCLAGRHYQSLLAAKDLAISWLKIVPDPTLFEDIKERDKIMLTALAPGSVSYDFS